MKQCCDIKVQLNCRIWTKFTVIQHWSMMLIHPRINIEMMARNVIPCIISWGGRWDFLLITNFFLELDKQITILFQWMEMSSLHFLLNILFCEPQEKNPNESLWQSKFLGENPFNPTALNTLRNQNRSSC